MTDFRAELQDALAVEAAAIAAQSAGLATVEAANAAYDALTKTRNQASARVATARAGLQRAQTTFQPPALV